MSKKAYRVLSEERWERNHPPSPSPRITEYMEPTKKEVKAQTKLYLHQNWRQSDGEWIGEMIDVFCVENKLDWDEDK